MVARLVAPRPPAFLSGVTSVNSRTLQTRFAEPVRAAFSANYACLPQLPEHPVLAPLQSPKGASSAVSSKPCKTSGSKVFVSQANLPAIEYRRDAGGGGKEMDNEVVGLLECYGALCHAVVMVVIKLIRQVS